VLRLREDNTRTEHGIPQPRIWQRTTRLGNDQDASAEVGPSSTTDRSDRQLKSEHVHGAARPPTGTPAVPMSPAAQGRYARRLSFPVDQLLARSLKPRHLRATLRSHIRVNASGQLGEHAVSERLTTSKRLQTGSELGAYRLESLLGAGGMGEVYRAKDVRLGRWVAIKVLLPQISADLEARRRFEREARAIANLNHPNICTLHDIGSEDGVDYIVMEYLEGDTLAAFLATCHLPMDRVLSYGIAIASALAAAHQRCIVHRDLKPGNIILAKSGVKVLDFGLAKFLDASAVLLNDETLAAQPIVLGTPADPRSHPLLCAVRTADAPNPSRSRAQKTGEQTWR
jgi:serine/threonine protein kinase